MSLVLPVYAAAPAKISAVAPAADLVVEADKKIEALQASLASDGSYADAKKSTIPRDAGVLAVLAQALVETDEDSALKGKAAGIRDGAIALAKASSYDDAKKGLAAIQDAKAGKGAAAKPEAQWNKLGKLGDLMKEVNARNGKLRMAGRKLPADPTEAARNASVMAVLALATHEDTHEVKNAADIAEWQKFAVEFQKNITESSAAFRKGDKDAGKAAWTKANTACNACHEKFRPE